MKIANIDLSDEHASKQQSAFIESLRQTGFAVISGHGIPASTFENVYNNWQAFFEHDSYKQRFLFDARLQEGFFPTGSEKAKNQNVADLKEFYHYFSNRNQKLPSLPINLNRDTVQAFRALQSLALYLLDIMEKSTPYTMKGLSKDWSESVDNSQSTLLRILHYPPLDVKSETNAVRSAAHEDINFITLLPTATQPGLQVKDLQGNWHDVKVDDANSIIVNIGDMMEEATGGYYKSTTHRVVNPIDNNVSRYSMPLFLHPKPSTVLSAKYTAGSYLHERLIELGLI